MISGRNLHEFSAFGKTYVFDAHRQQAFRLGRRALEIWEEQNDAHNPSVPLAFSAESDRRIWQSLADNHLVPPHLSPRPRGKPPRKDGHINFLMLHVAEGCNMRCRYCFSEGGLYGGGRSKLMSERVGRAAVDFLLQHCAADATPQIMFFGGEPLLNFRLIESLVAYAESRAGERGREISFSMTTNATLLNQRTLDRLLSHNVGLLISIDGVGTENDVHRIMSRGEGSFRYIAPRIRPLLSRRKTTARATLARGNVNIEKIVLDLLRFGFQGVQHRLRFALGMKHIVDIALMITSPADRNVVFIFGDGWQVKVYPVVSSLQQVTDQVFFMKTLLDHNDGVCLLVVEARYYSISIPVDYGSAPCV